MSAAEVTGSKGDLPEDRNPHYYTGRAAARGPCRTHGAPKTRILEEPPGPSKHTGTVHERPQLSAGDTEPSPLALATCSHSHALRRDPARE